MNKPNVIFILMDDLGYGDLGCNGHPDLRTPFLDEIAYDGTRYENFHVASPICSPSRATFLTGQYPSHLRIHGHLASYVANKNRDMPDWLDESVDTLPKRLKQNGYRTGHFGKWHLGGGGGQFGHPDAPKPVEYGYDETRVWNGNGPGWFCGPGCKPDGKWDYNLMIEQDEDFIPLCDRYATSEAIDFIDKDTESPFFVNLWLKTPHMPIMPTQEMLDEYPDIRDPEKTYYAMVTDADKQIGKLTQFLKDKGLYDNTIIMFSSDNGPETPFMYNPNSFFCKGSTSGFRGRKRSLYEGGIRTPFLVKLCNERNLNRVDTKSLLSASDIFPTICSLTNTKYDSTYLNGENVADCLNGQELDRQSPIMWEYLFADTTKESKECPMHAIRQGKFVLLKNPSNNRIELYDTDNDPRQLQNIASKHKELTKSMCKQIDDWTKTLKANERYTKVRTGQPL